MMNLYWFLPGHGDGRELSKAHQGINRPPRRVPTIDYLAQVALASEGLGFTGALVPTGLFCEDPWVVSSALATRTSRLKFLIAVRPGMISPLLLGQMASTFQSLSGDRLLFNVVTGGDLDEQRRYGDWLDHDQRYERTRQFLGIMRRLFAGEEVTVDDELHHLQRAKLQRPPQTAPALFIGGSSAGARRAVAEAGDVYLTWGETPSELAAMMTQAEEEAKNYGRSISCGTRFHVIARPTADEAWSIAQRLLETIDPERVQEARARFARSDSEGQRRVARLLEDKTNDRFEVYPNIWAGYSLVRPGSAALVGSYDEVAERITELHNLGLQHLILSGQPHLEEAYEFGEGVMPILRRQGVIPAGPSS